MAVINFETKTTKIGETNVVILPKAVSAKLPSRGMVMVKGTINNVPFQTPLEPDGRGSHWFKVNNKVNGNVKLEFEVVKDWPEPIIPKDLKSALAANPKANKTWMSITTIARWDWIRWINATKNMETRKIRIEKTFSKFNSGKRNPCCFNRSMCTDPEVSNNGVLQFPYEN